MEKKTGRFDTSYLDRVAQVGLKEEETQKNIFKWWDTWSWSGIFINTGFIIYLSYTSNSILGSLLYAILSIINVYIFYYAIKYDKYAFIWSSIISLNPIMVAINIYYVKQSKRWNHERLKDQENSQFNIMKYLRINKEKKPKERKKLNIKVKSIKKFKEK